MKQSLLVLKIFWFVITREEINCFQMENVCNFPFGKLFQIMEILRASERQQRVKNPEDLFPMKDIDNQRI